MDWNLFFNLSCVLSRNFFFFSSWFRCSRLVYFHKLFHRNLGWISDISPFCWLFDYTFFIYPFVAYFATVLVSCSVWFQQPLTPRNSYISMTCSIIFLFLLLEIQLWLCIFISFYIYVHIISILYCLLWYFCSYNIFYYFGFVF